MTYNERILKAIREQKKQEIDRLEQGKKYHDWEEKTCAFCKEFKYTHEDEFDFCGKCPITLMDHNKCSDKPACAEIVKQISYPLTKIPCEDMFSFLIQLEMYFEEEA